MKKAFLVIVVSLFSLSSIFSISLDEIIDGAKELSPTYQNLILSYENSLINIRNLERNDNVGVSVSATVDPLYEKREIDLSGTMGSGSGDNKKGFE